MPAVNSRGRGRRTISEINMVPFIDVMLVLLIIFMVTIPVMKHAIDVDLPRASSTPQATKAEVVAFKVNAQGQYFLNESALDDSALADRFKALAAKEPQPDLHIRGDSNVRYERVAQALAAAQQAGLRKVAFITEPKAP